MYIVNFLSNSEGDFSNNYLYSTNVTLFFLGGKHFPLRFLLLSALIKISYICDHMLSNVLQCLFEELVYFLSFKQLEV